MQFKPRFFQLSNLWTLPSGVLKSESSSRDRRAISPPLYYTFREYLRWFTAPFTDLTILPFGLHKLATKPRNTNLILRLVFPKTLSFLLINYYSDLVSWHYNSIKLKKSYILTGKLDGYDSFFVVYLFNKFIYY